MRDDLSGNLGPDVVSSREIRRKFLTRLSLARVHVDDAEIGKWVDELWEVGLCVPAAQT
jgi:hypothetical protein